MFDLIDNDDDNISLNTDHEIEIKFRDEQDNLDKDITALDVQISNLAKHIIVLESTVSSIEQALNSPANKTNPQFDRAKFYGALNKTLEILSLYYGNQQRFLELKYKYRKEQDDLKYRITRLIHVEIENFKNNLSNSDVLEVLKKFNFSDSKNTSKLVDEIDKLNSDPDYAL